MQEEESIGLELCIVTAGIPVTVRTEDGVWRGEMEIEFQNVIQVLWARVERGNGENDRSGKFRELRGHCPFLQLAMFL